MFVLQDRRGDDGAMPVSHHEPDERLVAEGLKDDASVLDEQRVLLAELIEEDAGSDLLGIAGLDQAASSPCRSLMRSGRKPAHLI